MNVFIPHKKDFNVYFDEIIKYANFKYTFGTLDDYKPIYEIVNIQFPEALFSWVPPTKEQLKDLEQKFIGWKIKSKIVVTLNDHKSHYDSENKFKSLFSLVQKYADGVIHLGSFSLNNFKLDFQNDCKHVLIFHPLYQSLLKIDELDYGEKIGLNFKSEYVVSAIGNIRSLEEAKFVLKTFKKIPNKNKLLIVPKMFNFLKLPKYLPYRFRHIYRFFVEKLFCFPLNKNQYFFGFNHIDYGLMVNLLQKSSLMIIPRLNSLNSGLVYMGLTFDKPMLIPKIGNLTELAECFDFPLLDVEKGNYKQVFSKLSYCQENQYFNTEEYLNKKEKFHPKNISAEYELFFKSLIVN